MNQKNIVISTALVIGFLALCPPARAQGTAFTYQGQLAIGANAANGLYDLSFALYGVGSGGSAVAGPVTNTAVGVTNGLFTTTVNFSGNPFAGASNWLQIAASPSGSNQFTTLLPRQQLTPTPYAVSAENLSGTVTLAQIPAAVLTNNEAGTVTAAAFSGSGTSLTGVAKLAGGNAFTGNQTVASGSVGIGTTAPFSALANTANNIYGTDGYGLSSAGLDWASSGVGYAAGFYNPGTLAAADGVVIGIAGTSARILELTTQGSNSVLAVNGNGRVGVGTSAPFSALANTPASIYGSDGYAVNNVGLDWAAQGLGYAAEFYNPGTFTGDDGVIIGIGGSTSPILELLSQTNNPVMAVNGNGRVGIGTTAPFSELANTANNIYGTDGYGLSSAGLDWASSGLGYAAGFYNPGTFAADDGVVIGIAGTTARILELTTQGSNSVMAVNGNGNVGIGTNNPATALQVIGTITATSFVGSGAGLTGISANNLPNGLGGASSSVTGTYAVVAGGDSNVASGTGAFVGGGGYDGSFYLPNTASGAASVVGGGMENSATTIETTVSGGYHNVANAYYATVGGGQGNTASGPHATVPGGSGNTASQESSFAAGSAATAAHAGTFVWSDGLAFSSTGDNQFLINASGGVGINTNNPGTNALFVNGSIQAKGNVYANGVQLTSDRNAKENFAAVSPGQVLQKVAALPITEWNYKTESQSARHLGPMAQDFHSAFGLDGADDTHISVIDEGGVALAAIQGLNEKVEAQNARLLAENAALKRSNQSLEQKLDALQKLVQTALNRP